MNIPKPLALPHLVQYCDDNPRSLAKALIDSAKGRPNFSYRSVDAVIKKFMHGDFSQSDLEVALQRVAPTGKEALFGELAAPLYMAFRGRRPKAVIPVERKTLTIPGGLTVPFNPGFVYVPPHKEAIILPFRLYWKKRVLDERSLQLFFSLARELMLEDDNIAAAELQLITMPAGEETGRELVVHNACDFDALSVSELNRFLATYAEAYEIACAEAEKIPSKPRVPSRREDGTLDLFQD